MDYETMINSFSVNLACHTFANILHICDQKALHKRSVSKKKKTKKTQHTQLKEVPGKNHKSNIFIVLI